MATKIPSAALRQSFEAGFSEIIDLVSPAIDTLVDIEVKKIAQLPQAAQDEIYSRFNAAFTKGIRNASAGAVLLKTNNETNVLLNIVLEVSSDIGIANDVLSDETTLSKAIGSGPDSFSEASIALIEKEIGKKVNLAKEKSLIINAVRKIFGDMDFKAPANKTNGVHDVATNGPKNRETNGRHMPSKQMTDLEYGKLTSQHYQTQSSVKLEMTSSTESNGTNTTPQRSLVQTDISELESTPTTVSNSRETITNRGPEQSNTSELESTPTANPREYTQKEFEQMADVVGSYAVAGHILSGMPFIFSDRIDGL